MALRTTSATEELALAQLGQSRRQVVQTSTPARVAEALREQISEGRFPPGARLREEAIAEALGVSRNTVREGFIELASEHLVVREPNRGVFVATLTTADVVDIFAARRTVERGAVRHAAVSPVMLSTARLALTDAMTAAQETDPPAAARADRAFHRALVAFAGSARLNRLIKQLLAELRWVMNSSRVDPALYFAYIDDNERILEYVRKEKRAAASRLLDSVLERTEQDIVRAMALSGVTA